MAAIDLPIAGGGRQRKKFKRVARSEAEAALDRWLEEHPRQGPSMDGRAVHLDRARALGTHTLQEWGRKVMAHNHDCHYCGRPWGMGLHKDHMIPISRGGSDAIDNLAPSCADCNFAKSTLTAEEFTVWAQATGFYDKPRRLRCPQIVFLPPLLRQVALAEARR